MNVLLIGSGGREHALAWKLAQDEKVRLFSLPGNPGTAQHGTNLPGRADHLDTVVELACRNHVDLVVVGPEAPLAAGLADALLEQQIPTFGPTAAAAQIEASKAFAKAFVDRHGIPTAHYAAFDNFEASLEHLQQVDYPVVIKASGLAAGKGVIVPQNQIEAEAALEALMVRRELGSAAEQVIIEERLEGEEVSLLAFTDGKTVRPMPPAQDHKRLLDGDLGPNTGGMGAYAPAPAVSIEAAAKLSNMFLQAAVDGLRSEETPFCGVLYAGLMLTQAGPRLLEYNCRFGDPETQAILPLLDTSLADILTACTQGKLDDIDIRWRSGAAACVVLASKGYPGKVQSGVEVHGLESPVENAVYFHAGTRQEGYKLVTAGGRVLGVTGWGPDIVQSLRAAYTALQPVHFEGMQYRRDIGYRALQVLRKGAH